MSVTALSPVTSFHGGNLLATGPLKEVVAALCRWRADRPEAPFLVFSDDDGRLVDLDWRGSVDDILGRLAPSPAVPGQEEADVTPRGPGRPKLGVVAREVTLLPRHWEWLASQPGGASVALRKLVEDARRQSSQSDRQRQSREAAYRFMSAMAGDEAGFEEASRALFAGREADFMEAQQSWPVDVQAYVCRLAADSFMSGDFA